MLCCGLSMPHLDRDPLWMSGSADLTAYGSWYGEALGPWGIEYLVVLAFVEYEYCFRVTDKVFARATCRRSSCEKLSAEKSLKYIDASKLFWSPWNKNKMSIELLGVMGSIKVRQALQIN